MGTAPLGENTGPEGPWVGTVPLQERTGPEGCSPLHLSHLLLTEMQS